MMYFIISEKQRRVMDKLLDARLEAWSESGDAVSEIAEVIDKAVSVVRGAYGLPEGAFLSSSLDSRHDGVEGEFRQALLESRLYHLP